MQATRALREKAMQLLAADTATLAQAANANLIVLCTNQIAPSELMVMADIDEATFDGYAALEVGLNAQPEALDPSNADSIIDLIPPVTGFRWETTGLTNLPQTIYGFALCNQAKTILFAAQLLPAPVTLTGTNQRVDVGAPTLRQGAGSIS